MKTLSSLLLLAALAAPVAAQFGPAPAPAPAQAMPGAPYDLTPSVANGQPMPSVTYPQQFSNYSTGSQLVGGSVMTNGSVPRPDAYSLQQSQAFGGNTFAAGQAVPYAQTQLNATLSQQSFSSTSYTQSQSYAPVYAQPAQSYSTVYVQPVQTYSVYAQPYTTSVTNVSVVGSQNGLLRQSAGFVGGVSRVPFRVARNVLR